ncbi:hypothetical protein [Megasphaera elsdenii]|uniref:hypothetical protein n=1 Tax=Megasphaera elsdenii TaxID=907 RepID=UPI00145A6EEB|nr:hypothetical protein [Megasphaera elsdenii]
MNKLKTIASAMVITMGFFSPVPAKVNQGSTIDTSAVSEIACQHMQNLADLGLVKLPVGCRDVISGHFTRDEMTILTLQAMSHLNMDVHGNIAGVRDTRIPGVKDVLYLRKLFYKDLQNKGMIDDPTLLTDLSPSSEASDEKKDEERKYRISGEIRYNYVKHSGNDRWSWRDSELRSRLFLEGRINDNWHAFGMIESTKHFLGHDHGEKDDVFNDKRLYVRGMLGNAAITAGRYGYMLGEGNIFDSSVTGVTVNWGDSPEYEATVGKTKAKGGIASASVRKTEDKADYGAGIHHFDADDWGTKTETIWNAYYNYYFTKHFMLGGMYLGTSRGDEDGRHNGFVAKAVWGNIQSWEPGSNEFDVRYYYQPKGTYVIHTMTGLADYMDGFQGFNVAYHHTLLQNLVLTLEYYRLRELTTGDKGNTVWGDLTYYF